MNSTTFRAVHFSAVESRPLCFHVYRVGGIWGEDKIIRADDRKTPRYYSKGTRLTGAWQFTLHVGGKQGVLACHVRSPYLGPPLVATDPGPISITIGPEDYTIQLHRGERSSDGSYFFTGLDDKEYRWRSSSGSWTNKMECLNSENQVVATYRIKLFAISKDGVLCIHQSVQFMTDLFVATCLAMRTPDH